MEKPGADSISPNLNINCKYTVGPKSLCPLLYTELIYNYGQDVSDIWFCKNIDKKYIKC